MRIYEYTHINSPYERKLFTLLMSLVLYQRLEELRHNGGSDDAWVTLLQDMRLGQQKPEPDIFDKIMYEAACYFCGKRGAPLDKRFSQHVEHELRARCLMDYIERIDTGDRALHALVYELLSTVHKLRDSGYHFMTVLDMPLLLSFVANDVPHLCTALSMVMTWFPEMRIFRDPSQPPARSRKDPAWYYYVTAEEASSPSTSTSTSQVDV
jgi:hypothetical protein